MHRPRPPCLTVLGIQVALFFVIVVAQLRSLGMIFSVAAGMIWEASRRLPLTQAAAMAIRIENRSGHLVRGVDCYGG